MTTTTHCPVHLDGALNEEGVHKSATSGLAESGNKSIPLRRDEENEAGSCFKVLATEETLRMNEASAAEAKNESGGALPLAKGVSFDENEFVAGGRKKQRDREERADFGATSMIGTSPAPKNEKSCGGVADKKANYPVFESSHTPNTVGSASKSSGIDYCDPNRIPSPIVTADTSFRGLLNFYTGSYDEADPAAHKKKLGKATATPPSFGSVVEMAGRGSVDDERQQRSEKDGDVMEVEEKVAVKNFTPVVKVGVGVTAPGFDRGAGIGSTTQMKMEADKKEQRYQDEIAPVVIDEAEDQGSSKLADLLGRGNDGTFSTERQVERRNQRDRGESAGRVTDECNDDKEASEPVTAVVDDSETHGVQNAAGSPQHSEEKKESMVSEHTTDNTGSAEFPVKEEQITTTPLAVSFEEEQKPKKLISSQPGIANDERQLHGAASDPSFEKDLVSPTGHNGINPNVVASNDSDKSTGLEGEPCDDVNPRSTPIKLPTTSSSDETRSEKTKPSESHTKDGRSKQTGRNAEASPQTGRVSTVKLDENIPTPIASGGVKRGLPDAKPGKPSVTSESVRSFSSIGTLKHENKKKPPPSKKSSNSNGSKKRRRRKRRKESESHRCSLVANIEGDAAAHSEPFSTAPSSSSADDEIEIRRMIALPPNQYETVLRRRAIRKKEERKGTGGDPLPTKLQSSESLGPPPPPPPPQRAEREETWPPGSRKDREIMRARTTGTLRRNQSKRRSLFAHADATRKSVDDEMKKMKPEEEIEGDVSLGMKLTIIGGQVIVQTLNALSDGRASPAQLTGMIQRGDVLLSIDGVSLVQMGVDKLVQGLKPLSSPEAPIGGRGSSRDAPVFRRELRLRFAIGEGLQQLLRNERQQSGVAGGTGRKETFDPAGDMFSLSQFIPRDIPMVDNLSGMPLFPEEDVKPKKQKEVVEARPVSTELSTGKARTTKVPQAKVPTTPPATKKTVKKSSAVLASVNQKISFQLALQREWERVKYRSAFYTLDDRFSELLRSATSLLESSHTKKDGNSVVQMTQSEKLRQGKRAMTGAKLLCHEIETVDSGIDKAVALRHIGSSFSARSRASSKRRFRSGGTVGSVALGSGVGSGVRSAMGEDSVAIEEEGTLGSHESEEEDEGDDEALVRLAAHDEPWRQHLMGLLRNATNEIDGEGEGESEEQQQKERSQSGPPPVPPLLPIMDSGTDDTISQELGSMLFGHRMSLIVTKKKAFALPPDEVTAVMFDLTTRLAMTMPEEVSVREQSQLGSDRMVLSRAPLSPRQHQDAVLATGFLFEKAFPAWLKSFRPLPWEQRRVLWPLYQAGACPAEDQPGNGSIRYDDGLSVSIMSGGTGWGTPPGKKKKLREQIEDLELNAETRAETCYMVTFYFTHRLMPRIGNANPNGSNNEMESYTEKDAIAFVKTYGSYLNLHTSLVCAADCHAVGVIETLLRMAKHDLAHRKAMSELTKVNVFVLYEKPMLSAILQRLPTFMKERKMQNLLDFLSLLVRAYPDLKPWQVLEAAVASSAMPDEEFEDNSGDDGMDFYYDYLSLLLDPSEGDDAAKQDGKLVEDWCTLSARPAMEGSPLSEKEQGRLNNFRTVACSRDIPGYRRDLPMLMNLSMGVKDYDLALDLAGEIISNPDHAMDASVLSKTLSSLRLIANSAVEWSDPSRTQLFDETTLRRVVVLFHEMSISKAEVARQAISVPNELEDLLEACGTGSADDGDSDDDAFAKERQEAFIKLIANTAAPADVVKTLSKWDETRPIPSTMLPALYTTLMRGAEVGYLTQELSGALLRIRRARRTLPRSFVFMESETSEEMETEQPDVDTVHDGLIWRKMFSGTAVIAK